MFMRKFLFTFILLAACILTDVSAKKGTIVLQAPNLHEVLGISPNGKWACGVFSENQVPRAYLWNLQTNEKIYLGEKGFPTEANDVSDNGVVCGSFITTELGAPQAVAGYWKEGKIYFLRDENGKIVNSRATAISNDGRYIAGNIIDGVVYRPCVWKDGVLERRLDSKENSAVPSDISEDGQIVIGWDMNGNRCPCYWDPELKPMSDKRAWFSESHSISPNKRYILASDAYGKFIYDLQTSEKTEVPYLTEPFNDGGTQIMDDKTALIWESAGGGGLYGIGIVYNPDGTWKKIDQWLKDNWNVEVPEGLSGPSFIRFSKDMKTLVGLTLAGADDYGQAIYYPLAWITDQEVDLARPVSLNARQVESTNNVMLTWTAPAVNQSAVTGYRIYRNDKKLADVAPGNTAYVDKSASSLKLTYEVCALYNTDESEKVPASVNLKEMRYAPAPNTFTAYQSNQSNVVLNWAIPILGYDANVKLHNDHFALPFGANTEMTYWARVKFDNNLVNCYTDEFDLKAIEMYVCQQVGEMTLVISSNGEELASKTIDQSKLVFGQKNTIELDNPIALPASGDVTVTVKVVQSGAGSSIGLADDPAVEGGNLISEDGETWITLSELSGGAYTYNWMIGMLLERKDIEDPMPFAPSLLSATTPQLSGYRFYRDNEKIGEIDLVNDEPEPMNAEIPVPRFLDQDVQPGRHLYEMEAVYNQTFASVRKPFELFVQEVDLAKCPAPTNINYAVKPESLNLNWEMPEYSEVSYTNWEFQAPFGYSGINQWFYGVRYSSEKMRPFAGAKITAVNFMPLADVTYALAIFENGIEKYRQPIEQYSLNKVNSVKLATPVEVLPNTEYLAAIHVSDVPTDTKPMGLDTGYPYADGRQISEDGEYFINAEVDMTGNVMISMDVEKTTPQTNPGITYKVYVDGTVEGGTLTDNRYAKPITAADYNKTVTVNIAAVYPDGEKKSAGVSILIDPTSISSEEIVSVKVYPNPATAYVNIEGNVSEASLFDLTGKEVIRTSGNTLEVGSLPAGIYLLKSTIDGKAYTNKIQVVK